MANMDNFFKVYYDNNIDFNMAGADQIHFFQKWFTSWSLKVDITYMAEIIYCFNEK